LATLLNSHQFTYQVVFTKMNAELITITKDEVFADELDMLNKLHKYWNDLVKISFRWKDIAEKEMDNFMDKKRIKRYLKDKLLNECSKIIEKISKLKSEHHRFLEKQIFLVDELKDRSIYIKKTF
jgi:hypothetical protein